MKKRLVDFAFVKVLNYSRYIPVIIFKIKDWLPFLLNYIGFKNCGQVYLFRNGTRIKTRERIDTVTIAVIFIKKDYGDVLDNSTIIDIGANIGGYSVFAATTSRNTKVYAYEPMPKSYKLLLENIQINRLENNIIPFNLGGSSTKERRRLFLSTGGSPFHSLYTNEQNKGYVEIECLSLQDIFDDNRIEQCDILKMDCEGAEYEIFYHTPVEYLKKIKEIRMEYHENQDINKDYTLKSLLIFLEKAGFEVNRERSNSNYSPQVVWLKRVKEGTS